MYFLLRILLLQIFFFPQQSPSEMTYIIIWQSINLFNILQSNLSLLENKQTLDYAHNVKNGLNNQLCRLFRNIKTQGNIDTFVLLAERTL